MAHKKKKRFILYNDLIIFILALALDRGMKYYALMRLKDHPSVSIIDGILEFRYLENNGAAFGLLMGQRSFFIMVAIIIILAIIYSIYKMPTRKHFYGAHICLTFIASGALGNLLDRVIYSYVVDFIYFRGFNFPIFNVADIYVSVATLLLILLLLFFYKEDDLNFLKFKEKKLREID